MNPIQTLIKAFSSFEREQNEVIKSAIQENEHILVDMNTNQLWEGKTSTGVSIASYAPYSPYTIAIKKAKNQPYDRVTLRDEGDFYSGFYIEYGDEEFTINSKDGKADMLSFNYGDEIFGLSDDNKAEFAREYLLEIILDKLWERLQ